jgi:polyadenylate-binding protein
MQPKQVAKIPAQLHVGQLDRSVKEADLYALLKPYGDISYIKLRGIGESSYAFVAFKDPVIALAVQKELNGVDFRGKRVHISRIFDTSNTANIYVKNIPDNIGPRELGEMFGRYGTVLSCKLCFDETGKSLGYGFVQYESKDSSENAISQMNGKVWQGKELTVQYFLPLSSRITNSPNTNLYIRGFPNTLTENDLKNIFSQYGQVISVGKMEYNGRAFGFVCFSSPLEAKLACDSRNGEVEGDFIWYVTPHMSKIHRKKMLREQYSMQVEEWKRKNLYIRNLDKSIDESRLLDICKAYGQVKSLKICKMENIKYDADGNCTKEPISKETAYVLFDNEASANNALQELQKKLIEGKKLYVARWKPRETLKKISISSKAAKSLKFGQMPPRGMPSRAMPIMPMMGKSMPGMPMPGMPMPGMPGMPQMFPRSRGRIGNPVVQPQAPRVINQVPAGDSVDRRRELGEQLYPKVVRMSNQEIAGKITGMLLEMDQRDVMTLINNDQSLFVKIKEAVEVLRRAWSGNSEALSKLPPINS